MIGFYYVSFLRCSYVVELSRGKKLIAANWIVIDKMVTNKCKPASLHAAKRCAQLLPLLYCAGVEVLGDEQLIQEIIEKGESAVHFDQLVSLWLSIQDPAAFCRPSLSVKSSPGVVPYMHKVPLIQNRCT